MVDHYLCCNAYTEYQFGQIGWLHKSIGLKQVVDICSGSCSMAIGRFFYLWKVKVLFGACQMIGF